MPMAPSISEEERKRRFGADLTDRKRLFQYHNKRNDITLGHLNAKGVVTGGDGVGLSARMDVNNLSNDNLKEVFGYLANPNDAKDILRIGHVSHSFREVVLEEFPWKGHCKDRWESKWGFDERWAKAVKESEFWEKRNIDSHIFWCSRYWTEERDAKRQIMNSIELCSMTFDSRRWFDGEHYLEDGIRGRNDVMPSSLYISETKELRFIPTKKRKSTMQTNITSGTVTGYPQEGVYVPWYIRGDGSAIDLGKRREGYKHDMTYRVVRLVSWGWELRSNNKALRAVDSRFDEAQLWGDYVDNLTIQKRPRGTNWDRGNRPYRYRELPDSEELKKAVPW